MISWQVLYKQGHISVGMWSEDNEVFFTCERPSFEVEDIEFSIKIEDLKRIVRKAETCEKEVAGD